VVADMQQGRQPQDVGAQFPDPRRQVLEPTATLQLLLRRLIPVGEHLARFIA
jgi:hypothetical protein